MDVTPEEVIRIMEHYQTPTLIHGHTHRPNTHTVTLSDATTGKRIVLGDWDSHLWYVKIDKQGQQLVNQMIN